MRQSKKLKNISGGKMSPIENAKIKNIDHLGIVAGLIDEIGVEILLKINTDVFSVVIFKVSIR
ncbi:hypothetical protein NUACC21_74500 [Scytonema sp. NUACC21]